MRSWTFLLCLGALFALVSPVLADEVVTKRVCTPDEANCLTDSEAWVKEVVGKGQRADLDEYCDSHLALESQSCGRLRPRFVRDLIATTAADDKAAPNGITIRHAMICAPKPSAGKPPICDQTLPFTEDPRQRVHDEAEPLDLRNLRSKVALDLLGNHLLCDLLMDGAYFEHIVNLDYAVIDGGVYARHLRTDGSLTMYHAIVRGDVEADGLRSAGGVTLFRSQIFGALHMRGAMVGGDLDFGNLIVLSRWPVSKLDPEHSSVTVPRTAVDLSNIHVARQFYMTGATISGSNVDFSGMIVDGTVWMEDGTWIVRNLSMERVHIGDGLFLGGSRLSSVDLTSARIDHELRLESNGKPTRWKAQPGDPDGSTWLVLRNARVGAIRDVVTAWPDCISLGGFIYDLPPHDYDGSGQARPPYYRWCRPYVDGTKVRHDITEPPSSIRDLLDRTIPSWSLSFGSWSIPFWTMGTEPEGEAEAARSIVWWRNWLERDPELTGGSYSQLATALGHVGGDADSVRYEQRIFDRQGPDWERYGLSCLEQILIGFGIGTYALRAAYWAALFVTIAAWRLHRRMHDLSHYPEAAEKGVAWCWFASLQTLLPLVTISKQMDDFLHAPIAKGVPASQPLRGCLAVGFSILALSGLLLSGFLLSGLRSYAGL